MKKLYNDFKPFLVIASAAWVFGFMGLLGASSAGKLVGVTLVVAYEEAPKNEVPNE